ncbi:hypothetical protein [Ligilactobacillus animalis]
MLIDLLVNIFIFLLIAIAFLAIVFILGVIVMVVSGVKKEIRENNKDRRQ